MNEHLPRTRISIFLSSRFDEFRELRQALRQRIQGCDFLPLDPIDFADGRVSHRPPLHECLAAVRRAEVMILLVGETYGDAAPNAGGLSYTHAEYEAAVAEGSEVVVLPFFIGPTYRERTLRVSRHERLAALQLSIERNHIYGCLGEPESAEAAAEEIFQTILRNLVEVRIKSEVRLHQMFPQDQAEEDSEASEDETGEDEIFSLATLLRLEARRAEGPQERPASSGAVAAAAEQLEIAIEAMNVGERFIALRHLRASLDHYPLDPKANFCLATVLSGTGRLPDKRGALRVALRAARLADARGLPILAAASLTLAARTAGELGDHEEAVYLAKQAVGVAGWLARAHLELAVRLLAVGRDKEAGVEFTTAFKLHAGVIIVAERMPSLWHHPALRHARAQLEEQLINTITRVRARAASLSGDAAPAPLPASHDVRRLARTARAAGADLLRLLQRRAREVADRHSEIVRRKARITEELDQATSSATVALRDLVRLASAGAAALALALTSALSGFRVVGVALLLPAVPTSIGAGIAAWRRHVAAKRIAIARASEKAVAEESAAAEAKRTELVAAIDWFEQQVLPDPFATPVRRARSLQRGALAVVRWDGTRASFHAGEDATPDLDWSIVPPALCQSEAAVSPQRSVLVRVIGPRDADGRRPAARWAAYFGLEA